MSRQVWNYCVDLIAFVLMLFIAFSGLVMRYLLPPGSRGGHGLTLWGLGRHDWGDLHFWAMLGLAAVIVLHIYLHWDWVVALTRKYGGAGGRTSLRGLWVSGIVFALVMVAASGAFWTYAARSVAHGGENESGPEGRGGGGGRGGRGALPALVETAP